MSTKGFQKGDTATYVPPWNPSEPPHTAIGSLLPSNCHRFTLTGPTLDEAYVIDVEYNDAAREYAYISDRAQSVEFLIDMVQVGLSPDAIVLFAKKLLADEEAAHAENVAFNKANGKTTFIVTESEFEDPELKDFTMLTFKEVGGKVEPTPTYNGEGLPAVGTVCEVKNKDATSEWARPDFYETFIAYIDDEVVVFKEDGRSYACDVGDYLFRPLKTQEEREREEFVKKVMYHIFPVGLKNYCTAKDLTEVEYAFHIRAMIDYMYKHLTFK